MGKMRPSEIPYSLSFIDLSLISPSFKYLLLYISHTIKTKPMKTFAQHPTSSSIPLSDLVNHTRNVYHRMITELLITISWCNSIVNLHIKRLIYFSNHSPVNHERQHHTCYHHPMSLVLYNLEMIHKYLFCP